MRYLILTLLISSHSYGKCEFLKKAANMLKVKNFISANKKLRSQMKEPTIKLKSIDAARSFVYKYPVLKKFGFGLPNKSLRSGWQPYKSRMAKSKFYNKVVGWNKKLKDGSSARIRLDWEPSPDNPLLGKAHYNIEFYKVNHNGRKENFKLKVEFSCGGALCSEDQVLRHVNKLSAN